MLRAFTIRICTQALVTQCTICLSLSVTIFSLCCVSIFPCCMSCVGVCTLSLIFHCNNLRVSYFNSTILTFSASLASADELELSRVSPVSCISCFRSVCTLPWTVLNCFHGMGFCLAVGGSVWWAFCVCQYMIIKMRLLLSHRTWQTEM